MLYIEKRQAKIIIGILLLVVSVLIGAAVIQKGKCSGFAAVDARIVDVVTENGSSPSTSASKAHYVTYEYEYNNKPYTASKQVFLKAGKKIGAVNSIRINPENPSEIENTLVFNTCISVAAFFLVISFLLALMLRKSR